MKRLFCLTLVLQFVAAAVTAASVSLDADRDTSTLAPGDTFVLSVLFDDEGGDGLSGFGTNLTFDTSVLSYTGASFSPVFAALSSPGIANSGGFAVQNITGASTFPIPGGQLVTGTNVSLVDLTFEALAPGTTTIAFSNVAASFANLASNPFAGFTPFDPAAPLSQQATVTAPIAPIPLPSSAALLGGAAIAVVALRKRRQRRPA